MGRGTMLLVLTAAGCLEPGLKTPWNTAGTKPSAARNAAATTQDHPFAEYQPPDPSQPGVEFLTVDFQLLRAELPWAPMRYSLDLWNHVDEMRIDLATAPVLARNGIHAGIASPDAWPAIDTILKTSHAQTLTAAQSLRTGAPLVLQIGTIEQPETVFAYGATGDLVGRTLGAGRRILYVESEPLPPRRERVRLVMELGVLPPEETSTWALTPDPAAGYMPTARFDQLVTTVTLDPGEILVIGPQESTTNEFLVGSRYFTRRTGGASTDTVLFISAQVTRHTLRK